MLVNMVEGNVTLRATGPDGETVDEARQSIREDEVTRWTVES